MKLKIVFALFLAMAGCVSGAEFIEIRSCIDSRTQQYPIKTYHRVCVCSPYRTGSTYVFNIMRFLFEDDKTKDSPYWGSDQPKRKVCKYHGIQSGTEKNAIVFTIRNPLHACFSLYRIYQTISREKSIADIVEEEMALWYKFEVLKERDQNFLLLEYEHFFENIDYVFSKTEDFFSIKIDERDKFLLVKALDRQNVIENIKKYRSFDESDSSTLLHGNHIQTDQLSGSEYKKIKEKILKCLEGHKRVIETWGYSFVFIDSDE